MELMRMPAEGESVKRAYCQPGGMMAALAEAREAHLLRVAHNDIDRITALLASGEKTTKAELVQALHFLLYSAKAAVDVAELRGERLDIIE
ncbi:hypothetical protein [Streptomyces tendae]|uniref:hypothetical protein n=1 Tax=Streptomyces tendae TaxID=1932 RepID=UPI00368A6B8E